MKARPPWTVSREGAKFLQSLQLASWPRGRIPSGKDTSFLNMMAKGQQQGGGEGAEVSKGLSGMTRIQEHHENTTEPWQLGRVETHHAGPQPGFRLRATLGGQSITVRKLSLLSPGNFRLVCQ